MRCTVYRRDTGHIVEDEMEATAGYIDKCLNDHGVAERQQCRVRIHIRHSALSIGVPSADNALWIVIR